MPALQKKVLYELVAKNQQEDSNNSYIDVYTIKPSRRRAKKSLKNCVWNFITIILREAEAAQKLPDHVLLLVGALDFCLHFLFIL